VPPIVLGVAFLLCVLACVHPATEDSPRGFASAASRQYEAGDLEGAADVLRRALLEHPENAQLRFMHGNALFRMGRFGAAAEAYAEAARRSPRHPDLQLNLGFALYRDGRARSAVSAWEEALRLTPEGTFARAALALGLEALGQPAEARKLALLAQRSDPDLWRLLEIDIRWTEEMRRTVRELTSH
jgi:Flp pilus assembly protein TadD